MKKNDKIPVWGFVVIVIVLIITLIVGIPLILNTAVTYVSWPSLAAPGDWIGFWGGYLGGLATLAAVWITIVWNKKEQDNVKQIELKDRIRKSALIIYYDFAFAFQNIHDFMFLFWRDREIKTINGLDDCDVEVFRNYKNHLNQFYFDSNWIHTVAELGNSDSGFEIGEIKRIYEIYGHLMTINKCLEMFNVDTCKNAYRSMYEIMTFTMKMTNRCIPEYVLKETDKKIVDHLGEVAGIKTQGDRS